MNELQAVVLADHAAFGADEQHAALRFKSISICLDIRTAAMRTGLHMPCLNVFLQYRISWLQCQKMRRGTVKQPGKHVEIIKCKLMNLLRAE